MIKIGIITIQSMNFGNRLQNYALQEILKQLGLEVETIRRNVENKSMKNHIKTLFQKLFKTKAIKFKKFDKKINKSCMIVTKDTYPSDLKDQYDYFIAGSDQIWNPYYSFIGKCDFLDFAEPQQRISYAASFGVNKLPKEKIMLYCNYLEKFSAISMREISGAEIVKELLGFKPAVVLDPTLLISPAKWREMSIKPENMIAEKYILVYALDKNNKNLYKDISDMTLKLDCRIIDIKKKNRFGLEWAIGPSEFIYLIDHAEMILTDSFHATVFSILFEKKVHTHSRSDLDMIDRVRSLIEILKLNEYMGEENILKIDNISCYKNIEQIIKIEIEKSIAFLEKSFSQEDC